MEIEKCAVCEAEFRPGHLVEGTCEVCKKLWPGAKTKEDKENAKKPEIDSHETRIKDLVTKRVNEMLELHGILHRCLDCGNLFYKRSPAQKSCGCSKKEVK